MMRRTLWLMSLLLAGSLLAGSAQAACKIGGKKYPEGTTYSIYVCKDGKWVKRK